MIREAGAATNRRRFLGLTGLSAVAVAGGGLPSACGEEAGSSGGATQTDKFAGVVPSQGPMPAGLPAREEVIQPPHPGFFIGSGMATPPQPNAGPPQGRHRGEVYAERLAL